MKRNGFFVAVSLVLALVAGTVYGQDNGPKDGPRDQGPGPGGVFIPGFGPMPGFEWKPGTVVTIEDKKATGQLILGERLSPVLKVGDQEYLLRIPPVLDTLKNGDTLTVEGLFVTLKDGTETLGRVLPFTVTDGGKVFDLRRIDHRGPGPQGPRPDDGPDR